MHLETTLTISFDSKKEFSQKEVEEAVKLFLSKLDKDARNIDLDFNQDEIENEDDSGADDY